MVYHFGIHRDTDGLWADCLELEGCHTQGDTMEELQSNAIEVLNPYLDEPAGSDIPLPLPKKVDDRDLLEVAPDPGVGLSVLLRHLRREHNHTQQQAAERLGMKNLYSYQRLERRANPSLATINRIRRVFPELSVDYVLQD